MISYCELVNNIYACSLCYCLVCLFEFHCFDLHKTKSIYCWVGITRHGIGHFLRYNIMYLYSVPTIWYVPDNNHKYRPIMIFSCIVHTCSTYILFCTTSKYRGRRVEYTPWNTEVNSTYSNPWFIYFSDYKFLWICIYVNKNNLNIKMIENINIEKTET